VNLRHANVCLVPVLRRAGQGHPPIGKHHGTIQHKQSKQGADIASA
jgi:hypothetical protein